MPDASKTNWTERVFLWLVAVVLFCGGYCFKADNITHVSQVNLQRKSVDHGWGFAGSNYFGFRLTRRQLSERLHATTEDIQETAELQSRKAKGEFILRNESPLMRRSQALAFAAISLTRLTNNAQDYNSEFTKLGIDVECSRSLQRHIARIAQASLEVESALIQLLEARLTYDKRIRGLLTPDEYLAYKDYEESKPSVSAIAKIRRLIAAAGLPSLSQECESAVMHLVKTSGLVEDFDCYGPYSPIPNPQIGLSSVIEFRKNQLERMQTRLEREIYRVLGNLGLAVDQQACVAQFLTSGS